MEGGGLEHCVLVAHGTWDLGVQLRAECARKGVHLSPWWLRFYDLREVFRWFTRSTAMSSSLTSMCKHIGVPVHGRLHSGVDDATTVASVMHRCLGMLICFHGTACAYIVMARLCIAAWGRIDVSSLKHQCSSTPFHNQPLRATRVPSC